MERRPSGDASAAVDAPGADLLASVARGDEAAFASLYDRYAPRLLGLIVRVLGHRRDAEDVLQEVFREVWTRSDRFDASLGSEAAWLLMLARSRAIDSLRRRRSRDTREASAREATEPDGTDPAEAAGSGSRAEAFLARLPAEQRDAVTLAYFRGLTSAQIAAVEGIPLGTVKTRIRLGMAKLRSLLDSNDEGALP